MGFKIEPLQVGGRTDVKVNEKLWLTADRKRVVKDGDPDARFLLARPGMRMSIEEAKKYGLRPEKKSQEPDQDKSLKDTKDKGNGGKNSGGNK